MKTRRCLTWAGLEGADLLDHRLPQRLLGADVAEQLRARHRIDVAGDVLEALLRGRLAQHRAQIVADLGGDRRGRAGRAHQREEAERARDRGQRFGDGRRLGPVRQALGRAHRKQLELAAVDRTDQARQAIHDHLHAAAHDVAQAGRRAGIVDRRPIQPGGELDPFGGQMRDAAAAEDRDIDLAGPLLHVVDQLAERVDAERGRHRNRHRLLAHEADRDEVPHQVVRIVLRDLGQRDEARRQRKEERVTVGRRRPRDLHADRAGRARMIGDERLLAPAVRQAFRHDPRDHVRRAAGACRHDQLDRGRRDSSGRARSANRRRARACLRRLSRSSSSR